MNKTPNLSADLPELARRVKAAPATLDTVARMTGIPFSELGMFLEKPEQGLLTEDELELLVKVARQEFGMDYRTSDMFLIDRPSKAEVLGIRPPAVTGNPAAFVAGQGTVMGKITPPKNKTAPDVMDDEFIAQARMKQRQAEEAPLPKGKTERLKMFGR